MAVRLVGRRDEAEDLVQEVYMQAWKSFDSFESGTNCRAWLCAILLNKVRHIHRDRSTRKVLPIDDISEDGLAAVVGTPCVPETISDEEILQALDNLPEPFREVVLLTDVQDLSYREAAQTLGVPEGTVMSRLNRARMLLRKKLAECARSYGIQTDRKKNR
jgi:RNA polymerase sigma-70 factor, ECF subfamily